MPAFLCHDLEKRRRLEAMVAANHPCGLARPLPWGPTNHLPPMAVCRRAGPTAAGAAAAQTVTDAVMEGEPIIYGARPPRGFPTPARRPFILFM